MLQWRRTLYTVWLTQFLAVAGFSFITPFIPYYVQELGITDVREAGLWAGLVTSAQAGSMALMAPVWGALADRYGRKMMVLRASLAGAIVMTMMGFVANVQQLLALRFLQGIFTGTVTASTALVASAAPKERAGMALGSLQTAIYLGVAFGPLLGGLSGDAFGYRRSFWVTGALLLLSSILVALFVHEDFHPAADMTGGGRSSDARALALVLSSGALVAAFAARILLRIGSRSLDPVLPLFVQTLLPAAASAGTTTGIISAIAGLGSAAGSSVIGSWSDRYGQRRLLIISTVAAGVCFLPQAFARDTWWLVFWQLLGGFAVGGTLSTLSALLLRLTPAGREGMVFGLDASAVSGATALGPITGAIVAAQLGLRAPFLVAALAFGIGALVVALRIRDSQSVPANQLCSAHGAAGEIARPGNGQ